MWSTLHIRSTMAWENYPMPHPQLESSSSLKGRPGRLTKPALTLREASLSNSLRKLRTISPTRTISKIRAYLAEKLPSTQPPTLSQNTQWKIQALAGTPLMWWLCLPSTQTGSPIWLSPVSSSRIPAKKVHKGGQLSLSLSDSHKWCWPIRHKICLNQSMWLQCRHSRSLWSLRDSKTVSLIGRRARFCQAHPRQTAWMPSLMSTPCTRRKIWSHRTGLSKCITRLSVVLWTEPINMFSHRLSLT